MKHNYLFLLLGILLAVTPSFINAQVVINEFCASNDTLWTDENGEYEDYIEIYNPGPDTVDIGGWYITDDLTAPAEYQIPSGNDSTIMYPGDFIILVADKQPEQGVLHVNIKLSGSGEAIGFTNDTLVYVDSLTYGEGGWIESPGTDNSAGRTVDNGNEWMVFLFEGNPAPTPGTPNNLPELIINEFCASNDTLWADGFGEYEDYIEIYNPNDVPINIGGWFITDDLEEGTEYQIPEGNDSTIILAKGFLLLVADKQPEQGVLHVNIKLSGSGEAIGLSRDGYNYVDSLSYGEGLSILAPETDNSAGLSVDGGEEWVVFIYQGDPHPTPGYSNADQSTAIFNSIQKNNSLKNYPNPFNGTTNIEFSLERSEKVSIHIFSVTGELIETLVSKKYNKGTHHIAWNASNLTSGIYFINLTSDSNQTIYKARVK